MLLISSVIRNMSRATGTELTLECPPIASAEVCYLVDDDPSVRRSISRLLEWEGFNARAFREPEAFLNHMATNPTGRIRPRSNRRRSAVDRSVVRSANVKCLCYLLARTMTRLCSRDWADFSRQLVCTPKRLAIPRSSWIMCGSIGPRLR